MAEQGTVVNVPASVAIVVPLLNEAQVLPSLLAALLRLQPAELVFVDGGSHDGSLEYLTGHPQYQRDFTLVSGVRGRAAQMNLGAQQTRADILLFLHADTRLPDDALRHIQVGQWGRFDINFHDNQNPKSALLSVVATMINIRSRVSGIATGDQAMYARRELFEQVNGFDDLSLMEDVALSKKLKRYARPHCITRKAATSARRWQQKGICKTVLLMWALRFAYFVGVPSGWLGKAYRQVR